MKPLLRWMGAGLWSIFLVALAGYGWVFCKISGCGFIQAGKADVISKLFALAPDIVVTIVLFVFFKLLYELSIGFVLHRFVSGLGEERRFTGILKLVRFIWWFLYVMIVISLFVGDVGTLLASFGLIGFGLTFALQKPILNFVGWLTIILRGTYHEGDRIEIGNVRGDVKEIQVMNTVLDGLLPNSDVPSNKLVTFPNELVLTSEVQNFTTGSNYILQELSITITYESNYHKAIKLLEEIIAKQIKRNKRHYLKEVRRKRLELNVLMSSLRHGEMPKRKKQKEDFVTKEQEIKHEQEELTKAEQELRGLEEEFRPRVQVEMRDSSIELTAQFLTPYKRIKSTRSAINLAFLDAINHDDDIEIAYPHMQLVYGDNSKKFMKPVKEKEKKA